MTEVIQWRDIHRLSLYITFQRAAREANQTNIYYLEPNNFYEVRVVAANPAGTSAPSATLVLLTYPTTGKSN